MELSSDIYRRYTQDEDIDIDLDLMANQQQEFEDEYMGEDNNTFADQTLLEDQNMHIENDDVMADDAYAEETILEGSSIHDEDIEDVEESRSVVDTDVFLDHTLEHRSQYIEDTVSEQEQIDDDKDQAHYSEPLAVLLNDQEEVTESQANSNDHNQQLAPVQTNKVANADAPSEVGHDLKNDEYNQDHCEPLAMTQGDGVSTDALQDGQQDSLGNRSENVSDLLTQEASQDGHNANQKAEDIGTAQMSQSIYITHPDPVSASEASVTWPEQPKNATILSDPENGANFAKQTAQQEENFSKPAMDTHPVVLLYQDNEMSLFPPLQEDPELSETFFLQDERLASESIQNLLGACRSVLGESIGEQDELVISIDDLDLHLSESAIESKNTTLAQILHIYVQLQHYDGLEDPPPLYMTLDIRTRFLHRLDFLLSAVAEGKGLSQTQTPQKSGDGREEPGALEQETGDELYHTDIPPQEDSKVLEQHEEEENKNENKNENIKAKPDESAETFHTPKAPSLDMAAFDSEADSEILSQEAHLNNGKERGEEVDGPGGRDRATVIDQPIKVPTFASFEEYASHVDEQAGADDGDVIDYQDDEKLPQGSSTESSTLQGDAFEAAANEPPTESELSGIQTSDGPQSNERNLQPQLGYGALQDTDAPFPTEAVGIVETTFSALMNEVPAAVLEDEITNEFPDGPETGALYESQQSSVSKSSQIAYGGLYDEVRNVIYHGAEIDEGDKAASFPQHDDEKAVNLDAFEGQEDDVVVETKFVYESPTHEDEEELLQDGCASYDEESGTLLQDEEQEELYDYEDDDELDESRLGSKDAGSGSAEQTITKDNPQAQPPTQSFGHPKEDQDEITYEDEDNDTCIQTSEAEEKAIISPGSLKRPRSHGEEVEVLQDGHQEVKRIRSA